MYRRRFVFALLLSAFAMEITPAMLRAQSPEVTPTTTLPDPKPLDAPAVTTLTTPPNAAPRPPLYVITPYEMEGPARGYSDNWVGHFASWITGGRTCGSMARPVAYSAPAPQIDQTKSVIPASQAEETMSPAFIPPQPSMMPVRERTAVASKVSDRWSTAWWTMREKCTPPRRRATYKTPSANQLRACDQSYRSGPKAIEGSEPIVGESPK